MTWICFPVNVLLLSNWNPYYDVPYFTHFQFSHLYFAFETESEANLSPKISNSQYRKMAYSTRCLQP